MKTNILNLVIPAREYHLMQRVTKIHYLAEAYEYVFLGSASTRIGMTE